MSTRRHDPARAPLTPDERHDLVLAAMEFAASRGRLRPTRAWMRAWALVADKYVDANRFGEAAAARLVVTDLRLWHRTGRYPTAHHERPMELAS